MKPPESESTHYEALQIVIDPQLRVVQLDPALQGLLPAAEGMPLAAVLQAINPRWPSIPEAFFADINGQIFLPWEAGPPSSPHGMTLHYLRAGEMLACTLVPTLGDAQALAEASLGEVPEGKAWGAALFMRLKKSENRVKIYSHHFPGFLYQQRADLSFSYLNPKFGEAFGLNLKTLQRSGDAFLDLIYEKDRDFYLREVQKSTRGAERFSFNYRIRLPQTGQIVYLQDVRTTLKAPNGLLLGYEGVWLDITRQAVAEKRLSSAGWKESLGTLTSGLLHDFKNSMTGIGTLSELYCRSMDPAHPWHEGMTMIRKNALEAQKIVQRIIDLNREEAGRRNYHNLRLLVLDQIDLVRIVLPKHMTVETAIDGADVPVYLDEVAFRQMILNLVINSRDASPHDGSITIRLRHVEAGEVITGDIPSGGFTCPREGAVIEVADQGHGIPPENLPHVFNPYYTTKEISKGSGLGLYNTRIFVQDHGGEIAISSQPDQGTTIRLFLPVADFTETLQAVDERGSSSRPASVRTVVVYHESDVAELQEQLRAQGCQVITFREVERLLHYLPELTGARRLLVLLGPQFTPAMQRIARQIATQSPELKVVHVHPANDTDALPPEFDYLLDLSLPPSGKVRRTVMQILDLLG